MEKQLTGWKTRKGKPTGPDLARGGMAAAGSGGSCVGANVAKFHAQMAYAGEACAVARASHGVY